MTIKQKRELAWEILNNEFGIQTKRELKAQVKYGGQVLVDGYEYELYGDSADFHIVFNDRNDIVSINKQSKEWVNVFDGEEL